jgi:hypothetical protein
VVSHRLTPATAVSSIRDYAVGDMAQKRFEKVEGQKKLGLNFHVRGDGTRAYYFSKGASGHCANPCSLSLRSLTRLCLCAF